MQTVITDDAVRKGIEADDYDMTWVTVAYGVGVIYGLFAGMSVSRSDRQAVHAGPGHARVLRRQHPLWRRDRARRTGIRPFCRGVRQDAGDGRRPRHSLQAVRPRLLVAIGFYGVFAYSTRHVTPLVNAYLDVYLSWRWMYWAYVPIGLIAAALVWRFIRPDRPPKPVHVPIDWLVVNVIRGLDRGDRVLLRMVPEMGRMVLERVRGHGYPLLGPARVAGRVARIGIQPR